MSALSTTVLAVLPSLKVCGECGSEKPAADFYVTRDKRSGGGIGKLAHDPVRLVAAIDYLTKEDDV
jgi:hypothetical protein